MKHAACFRVPLGLAFLIVSSFSAGSQTQSALRAQVFGGVVRIVNTGSSPVTIWDIMINNRPECTSVDVKERAQNIEAGVKSLEAQIESSQARLQASCPLCPSQMGTAYVKVAEDQIKAFQKNLSDLKAQFENLQPLLAKGHQIWIANPINLSSKVDLSPPILQVGQDLSRSISCPNTQIVNMTVQTDKDIWTWDFKD